MNAKPAPSSSLLAVSKRSRKPHRDRSTRKKFQNLMSTGGSPESHHMQFADKILADADAVARLGLKNFFFSMFTAGPFFHFLNPVHRSLEALIYPALTLNWCPMRLLIDASDRSKSLKVPGRMGIRLEALHHGARFAERKAGKMSHCQSLCPRFSSSRPGGRCSGRARLRVGRQPFTRIADPVSSRLCSKRRLALRSLWRLCKWKFYVRHLDSLCFICKPFHPSAT